MGTTNGNKVYDDLIIGKNGVAINIVWYDRKEADSELLYQISQDYPKPVIQRHDCLLLVKFTMTQVGGSDAGIIREQRSTNTEYRYMEWYRAESMRVWKMGEDVYGNALSKK